MVREILPIKDERADNTYKTTRPDFSSFSYGDEGLAWSLNMSNSQQNEDTLSITFARVPKYKDKQITKGMRIEVPIGDDTIDMVVKEVSYSLTPNRSTTTILLATRKIYLDTALSKGFVLKKENPSVQEAFDGIAKNIGVEFNSIDADTLDYPLNKVIISGHQNVLDYLQTTLTIDGNPIYNWWIDAFNTLHIHERSGLNATPIILSFDDIRKRLQTYDCRIYDRWTERKVSVASDINIDGSLKDAEEVPALEASISGSKVDILPTQIKEPKRVSAGLKDGNESSVLKKIRTNALSSTLQIAGIYLVKAHTQIKLQDFPIGDGKYIISNVNISDRGQPTTTLTLETHIEELPSPKKKDTRTGGTTENRAKKDALTAEIKGASVTITPDRI